MRPNDDNKIQWRPYGQYDLRACGAEKQQADFNRLLSDCVQT